jgi:hypothetical protein
LYFQPQPRHAILLACESPQNSDACGEVEREALTSTWRS